jgi:hypothetical protein
MDIRSQILQADDLPTEKVEVIEWGVTVYVRMMSGRDRDLFESQMLDLSEKGNRLDNFRARLCVLCCVDETGKRIFKDGDIAVVGNKSGRALDKVFEVASRLNKMTEEAIEETKKPSLKAVGKGSTSA